MFHHIFFISSKLQTCESVKAIWLDFLLSSEMSSPKIALQLKSNEDGKDGKQVR